MVTLISIVISAHGTIPKELVMEGIGRRGNKKTSGDHPDYSIVKNGHSTEKSPRDLRGLNVIQTPVKSHQLKLMWKTL